MKERAHKAGLITLAEFFRFGIKSLIGIALARLLTPSELGSYRQLFLIYATFSTLMMMGIPQSLLYFLPKLETDQEKRRHVGKIINLSFFLSIIFALILIASRGLIADKFNNPQLVKLILIYAVYPVFMFSSSLYSYVMLGQSNAVGAARFTIFSIITDAALILGTAFLTRDLTLIVAAVITAAFLQWLYSRIRLRGYSAPLRLYGAFYKQQFTYALPLGLSSIIGMLSIQLDKLVISAFFDPARFAIFSIGAMELPFISILTNSVTSVLLPEISKEKDKARISDAFRAAVRKNAIFIFPIALLSYLFAPQIITLLYTDVYREAIPFFRIYLLILPLRVATFGVIFLATGKTRMILYNSIFTLICNLVLNLILVKHYGMMGAAVATVLMTCLSTLLYMIWIQFRMGFKLVKLIPLLPLFKTAFAATAATLLSWLMMRGSSLILTQVFALLLFGLAYLGIGYLVGAILPYDIQTALGFLKGFTDRLRPRAGQ